MMYKTIFLIIALISCVEGNIMAQTMQVATYNIRFDNPQDSLDRWQQRVPVIADLINFHDFDIFGIQEGLHHQVEELEDKLAGYKYIGVSRDDGKQKGEYSAIFYKEDMFDVLKHSTFWLAENTEEPTVGWDAALPRICSWGQFKDKRTGFTFFLFNTHFDHRGEEARKESARLILEKIREIAAGAPVILTGDLNLDQESEAYQTFSQSELLQDTYDLAPVVYANSGTFNYFGYSEISDQRIDHIFVNDAFQVKRYGVLTDTYFGRYPSDHFPVMVQLSY